MKVLSMVLVAVVLAGCEAEAARPISQQSVQFGSIEIVTLDDGVTRCAVWDGVQAGGISCDWEVRK